LVSRCQPLLCSPMTVRESDRFPAISHGRCAVAGGGGSLVGALKRRVVLGGIPAPQGERRLETLLPAMVLTPSGPAKTLVHPVLGAQGKGVWVPNIASWLVRQRLRVRPVAVSSTCATLKHMSEVGIRALKQNASAVVAEAAAGKTVTITDRGRPVARMTAIPRSRLRALIGEGRARPARCRVIDLPVPEPGPDLSRVLREMRSDERY
jgi:prevent-host-death family protein